PANLQRDLKPAEPSQDRTAPISRITAPSSGDIVSNVVKIAGTAADDEGVVASVEVSTDGGATWHPAMGTSNWTYEWHPQADLTSATILSRATDDSNNTEVPGAGARVHGPRSTEDDRSSRNNSQNSQRPWR